MGRGSVTHMDSVTVCTYVLHDEVWCTAPPQRHHELVEHTPVLGVVFEGWVRDVQSTPFPCQ